MQNISNLADIIRRKSTEEKVDIKRCVTELFKYIESNAGKMSQKDLTKRIYNIIKHDDESIGDIKVSEYKRAFVKLYGGRKKYFLRIEQVFQILVEFYYVKTSEDNKSREQIRFKDNIDTCVYDRLFDVFRSLKENGVRFGAGSSDDLFNKLGKNEDVKNRINDIFATGALFHYAYFKSFDNFKYFILFLSYKELVMCNVEFTEENFDNVLNGLFTSNLVTMNMFIDKPIPDMKPGKSDK